MVTSKHRQSAFTIVELLIVIVVIGILAAITIVAYNGVQNRANDVAIQSDLDNFNKKILYYQADHGDYPRGGQAAGSSTAFPGITFSPSKNSYDLTTNNLSYCYGMRDGEPAFMITAKSKSGTVFRVGSNKGLQDMGETTMGATSSCDGMDTGTTSYSYGYNTRPEYGWFSWTNG